MRREGLCVSEDEVWWLMGGLGLYTRLTRLDAGEYWRRFLVYGEVFLHSFECFQWKLGQLS
jgi:hypothetical protein